MARNHVVRIIVTYSHKVIFQLSNCWSIRGNMPSLMKISVWYLVLSWCKTPVKNYHRRRWNTISNMNIKRNNITNVV